MQLLVKVLATVLVCTFIQDSEARPRVCPRRRCNCLAVCTNQADNDNAQQTLRNCPQCDCSKLCPYVKCGRGKKCVEKPIYCIRAPCPQSYECVPECVEASCANYCPYGRQFDANGCPTCDCLLTPCATVRCSAGYECQATEVGDCLQAPCPRATASCVPRNATACGPVCANYCSYGRYFDDNNCPTCECRYDPCIATLCPRDTTCVAEETGDCTEAPCPEAVAECVPNTESASPGVVTTAAPCPMACTKEYRPVCGTNGRTYGNGCMLRAAIRCDNIKNLALAYDGECSAGTTECPTICPAIYAPVCGSDGETYASSCNLRAAACGTTKQGLTLAYEGECTAVTTPPSPAAAECPVACTMNWVPVCGSDGNTYGNNCELEAAVKCDTTKQGLTLAYEGECTAVSEIPSSGTAMELFP